MSNYLNLKKVIIGCCFVIIFHNISCIRYYNDGFREDVFSVPAGTGWSRVELRSDQTFVNKDDELEIIFNESKYSGARFIFPFYKPDGIYEINIFARSEINPGRVSLFGLSSDYKKSKVLIDEMIPITKKNKEYSYYVKMPDQGYRFYLYFTKNELNTNKGRLFINRLKINREIFSSKDIKFKNYNKLDSDIMPFGQWDRDQASDKQAYVNKDKDIELIFDEKHWIGMRYEFPCYKKNKKYKLKFTARAEKQCGRMIVYDLVSRKYLLAQPIKISKKFYEYSCSFKMPEEENHSIWLQFVQLTYKQTGGRLFIRNIKINNIDLYKPL